MRRRPPQDSAAGDTGVFGPPRRGCVGRSPDAPATYSGLTAQKETVLLRAPFPHTRGTRRDQTTRTGAEACGADGWAGAAEGGATSSPGNIFFLMSLTIEVMSCLAIFIFSRMLACGGFCLATFFRSLARRPSMLSAANGSWR